MVTMEFDWFISLQLAYSLGSCVYWEIPSVVADNTLGHYQQPPRVYSQYTLATQGITYTHRSTVCHKCFYTLLFHYHLSTFHGTQYSMCMQYSHGLGTRVRLRRERSRERRNTESDETKEARLRRPLERASCL